MSAIALLMGLLLLSFLGSLIVRGRGAAAGLPSGIEYLGLGLAVGPTALGMVERTMIAEFEPIVQVALGWLAFIVGLDFGRVGHRQARRSSMILGVVCAFLTGIIVAVALHAFITRVTIPGLAKGDALLLAAGAGHEAIGLLVSALEDPVAVVRTAAARSLGLEAPHDSVAYRAVTSLRGSRDSVLRRLADSILTTIPRVP